MHAEEARALIMQTALVASDPVLSGVMTSSASVGGGTALPALPAGYVSVNINGTVYKLAYFNV